MGSGLRPVLDVVEGYSLELVVLALVVIYMMGQPSIQRGHFGLAYDQLVNV
jgi:hypothetical protein